MADADAGQPSASSRAGSAYAEDLDLDDVPSLDPALQLGRGALGDDAAAGDHGDPVAQLVRLEHVVRGEEHGRACSTRPATVAAARARRPGRCRWSARRGRAPRARAAGRGRCAAAAACRASSPRPVPARGRSSPTRSSSSPIRALLARGHAVQLGEVPQVVAAPTAARRGRGRRRRRSRPPAHLARRRRPRRGRARGPAPGRQQQRDEHLDGRGLAGAVGPEEAEQLASLHLEVDAAHRLDPLDDAEHAGAGLVGASQVVDLDDRVAHWASSSAVRARSTRTRCRRDRRARPRTLPGPWPTEARVAPSASRRATSAAWSSGRRSMCSLFFVDLSSGALMNSRSGETPSSGLPSGGSRTDFVRAVVGRPPDPTRTPRTARSAAGR